MTDTDNQKQSVKGKLTKIRKEREEKAILSHTSRIQYKICKTE